MAGGRQIRVLIVEDDVLYGSWVRRYLEGHGLSVREAMTADEARHLLWADQPDVVVTDLVLPDARAVTAGGRVAGGLNLVRSMARAGEDAPAVVAVSDTLTPRTVRQLRRWGAAEVLSKPFEPRKLLQAVRQAVKESARTAG